MAWMGHSMEGRRPGIASPEEINRLRELPPQEADKLFLRLMIEHHRAAIPMAEAVLDETNRPAAEELAGAMVSSQRAEIETMQKILEDMGAPPSRNGSACRWTREKNTPEGTTVNEPAQQKGVELRA
jgi:uncharacterized protein (DUF305 family)